LRMLFDSMADAFAVVGALLVASQVLSLLGVLYKTLLRPGKDLRRYGEWAVVTGATDGIGKAFAFELARKGSSVLLLSRSAEKLAATKAEIEAKYPAVAVKTHPVDFSSFGAKQARDLQPLIDGLAVGVLVNNVGVSYEFAQWFHELSDAEVEKIVALNVESTTWMTRLVLPGMLKRKSGVVVNMSSAAARAPLPLLAQYSASKGYIENFTRSLDAEYRAKGVSFQCQSPLWVATAMTFPGSKLPVEKRATLTTPTAQTYARYACARIGYEVMASPYWVHEVYVWLQERLPDALKIWLIFNIHKKVRFHKKNLAKIEEKLKSKDQ